jgi:hypothetical protein
MFPSTFDADDARAGKGAQLRRREPAPQCGMQQAHLRDRASSHAGAKEFQRGFYLGELGHRAIVWC